MVKDVIIQALQMLNLERESEEVAALAEGQTNAAAERFLRFYNLVVTEIAEEYRRTDYLAPPTADSIDAEAAEFYGISERTLAYGVAAEYCVTEGLDEAVTWDARYKGALALAKKPRVKIAARRLY